MATPVTPTITLSARDALPGQSSEDDLFENIYTQLVIRFQEEAETDANYRGTAEYIARQAALTQHAIHTQPAAATAPAATATRETKSPTNDKTWWRRAVAVTSKMLQPSTISIEKAASIGLVTLLGIVTIQALRNRHNL